MRHERGVRRWSESKEMPEAYHRMSYVLFRTDGYPMTVIAVRCPDPKLFYVGQNIISALGLDTEAIRYLKSEELNPPVYCMETKLGIGLLHKGYDRHAGLGLYLHIHGSPVSLSRLIRGGVLPGSESGRLRLASDMEDRGEIRPWDAEAYGILLDAWTEIRDRESRGGIWPSRSEGLLSPMELERGLEDLAAFAGVGLTVTHEGPFPGGNEGVHAPSASSIRCYRPALLEAILLFLLSSAANLSADQWAVCRVATRGESRHLLLALEFSFAEEKKHSETLRLWEEACRHMSLVAELGGLQLQARLLRPSRTEKKAGQLPCLSVCLEWMRNPSLLPTTDLKARLKLVYEDPRMTDGTGFLVEETPSEDS